MLLAQRAGIASPTPGPQATRLCGELGSTRSSTVAPGARAGHRHLEGPNVFSSPRGEQLTHSVFKDIVPRICSRAGLPKRLTWHVLRDTYASHRMIRGVPLAAVKELLGHADVATTMIYAHLSPDVKRDAVRLLDAPRAGQPGSQPSGTCTAHEV